MLACKELADNIRQHHTTSHGSDIVGLSAAEAIIGLLRESGAKSDPELVKLMKACAAKKNAANGSAGSTNLAALLVCALTGPSAPTEVDTQVVRSLHQWRTDLKKLGGL